METRIIHTKFWTDSFVQTLSGDEMLFYLWLFSNQYINVLGMVAVDDSIIAAQSKVSVENIPALKQKFVDTGKILVFGEYIYLRNSYKYQTYSGVKNIPPRLRIIYEMSDEVLLYFRSQVGLWMKEIENEFSPHKYEAAYDRTKKLLERVRIRVDYLLNVDNIPERYPNDTPIDTAQKTEIRNLKTENQIRKPELELSSYNKEPVILWNHDPADKPVGKFPTQDEERGEVKPKPVGTRALGFYRHVKMAKKRKSADELFPDISD